MASGPVVVQGTIRRAVLTGHSADIVDEVLDHVTSIDELYTGRVIFHVSGGSVVLELCQRFPTRTRAGKLARRVVA